MTPVSIIPYALSERDQRQLDIAMTYANRCQRVFEFHLADPFGANQAAARIDWDLVQTLRAPGHAIFVSSLGFDDNWFCHTAGTTSAISTANWGAYFAPPNVDGFLLREIALCLFIQTCDVEELDLAPHGDATADGCLFDMCVDKNMIKWSLRAGFVCGTHQTRYKQLGGTTAMLDALVKIVELVRKLTIGQRPELAGLRRKPSVFIGSSAEGRVIAQTIQVNMDFDVECTIWHDGIFKLSEGTLDALIQATGRFDFAILVLTPDDLVEKRGSAAKGPRDNVLFELGLFMGAIGRERTFMIHRRAIVLDLPTDLAGIRPATFDARDDGNLQAALRPPCTEILAAVRRLGFR